MIRVDPVALHDSDVDGIPRRQSATEHEVACSGHIVALDGVDLVDHAEERIDGRLDGLPTVDRGVAVQDLSR